MTEDIVRAFSSFNWEIIRLVVERNPNPPGQNVTTLHMEVGGLGKAERQMAVKFTGVTRLRFSQDTSNLAIFPQIVSIIDRGWETARYEFTDPPQNSLTFYFMDAELDEQG